MDADHPDESAQVWFCRVCGADAPDFVGALGKWNRANPLGRAKGVVAQPCGHEQPLDRSGLAGLGLRSDAEQRAHRVATSPAPSGTRAYLGALANQPDRRRKAALSGVSIPPEEVR